MKRVLTFILMFSMILGLAACGGEEPATKPYTTIPAPKDPTAAAETKTGEGTTAAEPDPSEDPSETEQYRNYDITGIHILEKGFTDKKITDEASAAAAASACSDAIGCRNALNELKPLVSTIVDGQNYYRLQQYCHGIPVYGRYVDVIASDEGEALGLSSDAKDLPDDIDLLPTVTNEEILAGVREHALLNQDVLSDSLSVEPVSNDKLVIYDLEENASVKLAYELLVQNDGQYYVIADAKTGEVLDTRKSSHTYSATTGRTPDGSVTGPAIYNETTDEYFISDYDREIFVFDLEGRNSVKEGTANSPRVISKGDSTFGNTEDEKKRDPEYALALENIIGEIRDFYVNDLHLPASFGRTQVFYHDSYYLGYNAIGGLEESGVYNLIKVGNHVPLEAADVLAHEFTHSIQHHYGASTGGDSNSESGAICEGLADVFACFFTGEWDVDLSWVLKLGIHRNAKDPSQYNYAATIKDLHLAMDDYAHTYATVISHAAYLMSQSGKFDRESLELEKLWFQTMIRLPHKCRYLALRSCMEHTANILNYSDEQKKAVAEAFDAVMISYYDLAETYGNDISITVYDRGKNIYDDYTVDVYKLKKSYSGNTVTIFELKYDTEHFTSREQHAAEPLNLHLDDSTYRIVITDRADGNNEKSFTVKTSVSETKNQILVFDFGALYTCAPGAKMTVLDKEGKPLTDYKASIVSANPYTEIRDGIVSLQEKNYYNMLLTHREGEVMRLFPFTLRVKNGAPDSITVQTQFEPEATETEKETTAETAVETSSAESTQPATVPYADIKERLQGPWQTSNRLYLFCFNGDRVDRYHKVTPGEPGLRYMQDASTGYRIEPMDDGKGVKVILDDAQNGTEYWYFNENPNGMDCRWYSNGKMNYSGSSSLERVTQITMDDIEVVKDDPFAEIVRQYENTYGALNIKTAGTYKYYTGVFLVKRMDFDLDGTEELLIGYANEIPEARIASPRMDVWGLQGGAPVKLYEGAGIQHGDIGSRCEFLILDGTPVLVTGFDGGDINLRFQKLEQGSFREAKTLGYTFTGKDYEWSVDGKKVSETEGMKLYGLIRDNSDKYNGSLSSAGKQTEESLIKDLDAGYASVGLTRQ